MPIFSLWRASDNTSFDGEEARGEAHAVATFSQHLDVELTWEEGQAASPYMMRRVT